MKPDRRAVSYLSDAAPLRAVELGAAGSSDSFPPSGPLHFLFGKPKNVVQASGHYSAARQSSISWLGLAN